MHTVAFCEEIVTSQISLFGMNGEFLLKEATKDDFIEIYNDMLNGTGSSEERNKR